MPSHTMKSSLYKIIDALPETSLAKAKHFLEGLLSRSPREEATRTIEDDAWMSSSDEDLMNALEVIEKDVTKAEMNDYLTAIERNSKPVKWDSKRGVFVVQDS